MSLLLINLLLVMGERVSPESRSIRPIVINTWPYPDCSDAAWSVLANGGCAMDAVVAGCTVAENNPMFPTVGFGGSPDEQGNTTLDAMIMDGETMQVGSVGALDKVKDAIKVARAVLLYTRHTLLVGPWASQFAVEMGFHEESLSTPVSQGIWKNWKQAKCQPNFRRNVVPDPQSSCGPYKVLPHDKVNIGSESSLRVSGTVDEWHHDTIGIIALDSHGHMAVGTSTNGATHKVPGRVGDSPIIGSGGYVDDEVGGAAGTGDGDILMRFLVSYQTVEFMRQGMPPTEACEKSLRRVKQAGEWQGAIVAMNNQGEIGAACYGFPDFYYSLHSPKTGNESLVTRVECFKW